MNALILRLKNSIDKKILDSIDGNLMIQYQFVPISVKDNFLFVAVSKNSNKDDINGVLKKTFSQSIKFMLVGDDDLKELLTSLLPGATVSTPSAPAVGAQQPAAPAAPKSPLASNTQPPKSGTLSLIHI